MGEPLKILLGAASLCVIAVTVWLGFEKYRELAQERADVAAQSAEERAAKGRICGHIIAEFDRGNHLPARAVAGEDRMPEILKECRAFLDANPAPTGGI